MRSKKKKTLIVSSCRGPRSGRPTRSLGVCLRNTALLEKHGPWALCEMGWMAAEPPGRTAGEDKTVRIVTGLLVVVRRGDVCRRDLQSLVGLLSWFTCGAQWLKPWMAVWFHMLLKPALRFQHLDESQLAEVQRLLDSNLRLSKRAHLSDVQQGWQVAECGSKSACAPRGLKKGRAWVKFLDAESANVRPPRQEAEVAEFFLRAVRLRSPVHLAASFGGRGPAAADAFASGSVAGIGG